MRRSMESSHKRAVCWIQRAQKLVGGVSWTGDSDAWRSLAGDVVGVSGRQKLDIMCVRMPWREIRSSGGIVDEVLLTQRKKADGNTCNSLRRSVKSYDTTTGCEKTWPCQGEMVVVATSNGRD